MPIDLARKFKPIRIAVLTISDSRGRAEDTSGDLLAEYVANAGHQLGDRTIVKDDVDVIAQQLRQWIADPQIDCVISTGGTGLTGRDVAPEAFARVWDKEIPGFGELFRHLSYKTIGTSMVQSRLRRCGERNLSFCASWFSRGSQRWLGWHSTHPAR